MKSIPNYLVENDIKPSLQRIKIFEYIHQEMNHPTADIIFNNLSPQIPTLSKTTVYNTLKLFIDKGIAATVTIEDNEVRYDVIMEDHAHFKCVSCNTIYDIFVDYSKLNLNNDKDFQIDETQINLKGKCKKCLTK